MSLDWGQRSPLSDASGEIKIGCLSVIYQNSNGGGADAGEDQVSYVYRKAKEFQCVLDERPFKFVKGFFQVDLKDHTGLVLSYSLEMSDVFLKNDGLVIFPPIRKKAFLSWSNNGLEERLDSINNDFSNNFVGGVAEANWYKILEDLGIPTFWYEAEQFLCSAGILEVEKTSLQKEMSLYFFTKGDDLRAYIRPKFLIEHGVHPIWPWGLKGFERFDSQEDLRISQSGLQGILHKRGKTLLAMMGI